jgi:hypothetical protein
MRLIFKISIYVFLIIILAGLGIFFMPNLTHDDQKYLNNNQAQNQDTQKTKNDSFLSDPGVMPEPEPKSEQPQLPEKFLLQVPYINEAPSGNWTGPWKNACEEASIAMVHFFYQGQKEVSISEAEEYMQMLFDYQDKVYSSNHDADASRMIDIIANVSDFKATIKEKPTIDDLKKELLLGHPVIAPHYGYDLHNPNIPFLRGGTYYHMMVLVGYDDQKQEFIVNDDGDIKAGANHRYSYEVYMNSIHDFNFKENKANGPARAIFTLPIN